MTPFRMDGGALEVGEATDAEMAVLHRAVAGQQTDVLSDWILVAVRGGGRFQLVALGGSERTGRWRLTSPVVGIDGLRAVRTKSGSHYALGVRRLCGSDPEMPERVRQGLRAWRHVG